MAASSTDINNFMAYIRDAESTYGSQLANWEKLGRTNKQQYKVRLLFLTHLVNIMQDYFSQPAYLVNNFYTTIEIKTIINHINNICDTEYTLSL